MELGPSEGVLRPTEAGLAAGDKGRLIDPRGLNVPSSSRLFDGCIALGDLKFRNTGGLRGKSSSFEVEWAGDAVRVGLGDPWR